MYIDQFKQVLWISMEYNLFFVLKIGCMASSEYLLSTSYTCTLPVTKNGDQ